MCAWNLMELCEAAEMTFGQPYQNMQWGIVLQPYCISKTVETVGEERTLVVPAVYLRM